MSGRRMNWRGARLSGKPTLDHRYENDVPDRADRWLRAAERRLQEQRITAVLSSSAKSTGKGI
jgi:hypothetical protein